MMAEHAFAQYVRILGKGRNGSRTLSTAQAHEAMMMILHGQVLPEQVGAFLMLIRIREETPEETAGFVQACRDVLPAFEENSRSHLDWPSYAGKRRQLPWFILSALLLAGNGLRVFMHVADSRDDGRVYAEQALRALGIAPARSLSEACEAPAGGHFAWMPLSQLNPVMQQLLALRETLGLRSPVNTVARMLNPARAHLSLQGIFHPGYQDIHQNAAMLMRCEHVVVIKGEGGEAERNPDGPCRVKGARAGVGYEEEWPALFNTRHLKDEQLDVTRLAGLWRDQVHDEYAEATVIGTAALALKSLGHAHGPTEAQALASELWKLRPENWPGGPT